jgi:hypothetical protein
MLHGGSVPPPVPCDLPAHLQGAAGQRLHFRPCLVAPGGRGDGADEEWDSYPRQEVGRHTGRRALARLRAGPRVQGKHLSLHDSRTPPRCATLPAVGTPEQKHVLPMEIQIGDRFTDQDFEWEVLTRPATLHGGKSP